jgi:hypothetical protein
MKEEEQGRKTWKKMTACTTAEPQPGYSSAGRFYDAA